MYLVDVGGWYKPANLGVAIAICFSDFVCENRVESPTRLILMLSKPTLLPSATPSRQKYQYQKTTSTQPKQKFHVFVSLSDDFSWGPHLVVSEAYRGKAHTAFPPRWQAPSTSSSLPRPATVTGAESGGGATLRLAELRQLAPVVQRSKVKMQQLGAKVDEKGKVGGFTLQYTNMAMEPQNPQNHRVGMVIWVVATQIFLECSSRNLGEDFQFDEHMFQMG